MTKRSIVSLLLALMMVLALAACGQQQPAPQPGNDEPAPVDEPAPAEVNDTLVVGYDPFNSKFSPFFSETAYDQDAYAMTQLSLLTSDRTGAIIQKGIEGEISRANGKLNNPGFLAKAPAHLVEQEKEKLKTNEQLLEKLAARIAEMEALR